ncbi:MAG: hypothetical protein J6W60_07110 [Treponema sp.]|nr:hypothetical protein [Treponema sp.]
MIGHCSKVECPFMHEGELFTDKKCVNCFLWEITGLDIDHAVKMMVLKKKELGDGCAEKVYMRREHFLKLLNDGTDITAFRMDDGGLEWMIAGCVIEVRDDMNEDVLLYVE